ncbi:MAG TPA: hypothetical protein VF277_08240 [Steroidobacteraceae bacterium]
MQERRNHPEKKDDRQLGYVIRPTPAGSSNVKMRPVVEPVSRARVLNTDNPEAAERPKGDRRGTSRLAPAPLAR